MADCGASGSALDRAASALASSAAGTATHQASAHATVSVASFFGSAVAAATTNNGPALMPVGPPDRLLLHPHSAAAPRIDAGGVGHRYPGDRFDGAWDDAVATMPPPNRGGGLGGTMPHHPPPQMIQMRMQMMQQQQAQMQMMQHQVQMQQMWQHQRQQQDQQQQQRRKIEEERSRPQQQRLSAAAAAEREGGAQAKGGEMASRTEGAAILERPRDALDEVASSWHDELQEGEIGSFHRRNVEADDGDYVAAAVKVDEGDRATAAAAGHEGGAEAASIEQLARAWAEAEDEYAEEYAAVNMAAATQHHLDGTDHERVDLTEFGEEEMAPYQFSDASRAYLFDPTAATTTTTTAPTDEIDLLSEGMRLFEAGDVREAILAFESHLQNVDPDSSDAWRMLGQCHAENDEDRRAIACLERAADRDPYSREAHLALGVSYVNELDHGRALRSLRRWMSHNPSYAGMDLPPEMEDVVGSSRGNGAGNVQEASALIELKSLLRRAMETDPSDAADVLEALGVVCNVSREYDVAVDSFRTALESRPDDYQLWNKLGATLANSGKSDEALSPYHRALSLKPKYARAWLNMAISHSNLQNYDEAARCYLQTLSLNPGADHVWGYLRIALTCSESWDLLPLAAGRNLSAFAEHYDFVHY